MLSFVFSMILFFYSFMCFLSLALSYFFMCFLLYLSFLLVWFFFSSRNSCCWHFVLFLVSFYHDSAIDLYSTADLYSAADHFPMHLSQPRRKSRLLFLFCFLFVFLGGPLGLAFYWAFLLMGFWVLIGKNEHQQHFWLCHYFYLYNIYIYIYMFWDKNFLLMFQSH